MRDRKAGVFNNDLHQLDVATLVWTKLGAAPGIACMMHSDKIQLAPRPAFANDACPLPPPAPIPHLLLALTISSIRFNAFRAHRLLHRRQRALHARSIEDASLGSALPFYTEGWKDTKGCGHESARAQKRGRPLASRARTHAGTAPPSGRGAAGFAYWSGALFVFGGWDSAGCAARHFRHFYIVALVPPRVERFVGPPPARSRAQARKSFARAPPRSRALARARVVHAQRTAPDGASARRRLRGRPLPVRPRNGGVAAAPRGRPAGDLSRLAHVASLVSKKKGGVQTKGGGWVGG